jgi:hypothetical protein
VKLIEATELSAADQLLIAVGALSARACGRGYAVAIIAGNDGHNGYRDDGETNPHTVRTQEGGFLCASGLASGKRQFGREGRRGKQAAGNQHNGNILELHIENSLAICVSYPPM